MATKILGPVIILILALVSVFFEPVLLSVDVLPMIIIAVVISPMLLEWIIGKRDLCDPSGLVAVLLFQFMVVSPMFTYINDTYRLPMENTRPLLGSTMWWCVLGIFAFFIGHSLAIGDRIGLRKALVTRIVNVPNAKLACVLLIVIGFVANIVYMGIVGFRGGTWGTRYSATGGLGYIKTIAQFSIIGLLLMVSIPIQVYQNKIWDGIESSRRMVLLVASCALISIMSMVIFKGSRGQIIMYLFWIAGMLHFTIMRIKLRYLIIPMILAIPLLHIYGLYKSFGMTAFVDYFNPAQRSRMREASGQSMVSVLTGDLGRISVWMFANQEISSGRFGHTWGKTYAEGSVVFIPRALWPNRPHGMPETITDMVRGRGAYESTQEKTARVAGLLGEAYINFGWPFTIVVMFFYGILVKAVSSWVNHSANTVPKAFIAPYLILMCFNLFMWDWVWMIFKIFSQLIPVYIIYRMTMPKCQEEPLE